MAQFTGTAFGAAAIWQYEALKSRVQSYFEEARADWLDRIRPQKRGSFRKQVRGRGVEPAKGEERHGSGL